MNKILIIIFFLLSNLFLFSQEETKKILHTIETNFSVAPAKVKEYINSEKLLGINYILSYNYKDRFMIGGGFGYENNLLKNNNRTNSYIPFFVDLRYDFLKAKITPFVAIQGGYLLGLTKVPNEFIFTGDILEDPTSLNNDIDFSLIHSGGLLLKPFFGVKFKTNKSSFNLGLGYRLQNLFLKYKSKSEANQKLRERNYNMITLNFGVTF